MKHFSRRKQVPLNLIAQRITLDHTSGTALFVQIADGIEWCVSAGILKGGSRLPSYGALASHLGVDRETVARAYRDRLAPRGFISVRKGAEAIVAEVDIETALEQTASRQFSVVIRLARAVDVKPEKLKTLFYTTIQREL